VKHAIVASYVKKPGGHGVDSLSIHLTAESVVMHSSISMPFTSKSEFKLISSRHADNVAHTAPVSSGVCDEQVFASDS